jgi:hypothetical protein
MLVFMTMAMLMRVFMARPMMMAVFVRVSVFVVMMTMAMFVVVVVRMIVTVAMVIQVHIKLHPVDASLLRTLRVDVVAFDLERLKLAFELLEIRAQIQHGPDEHIAANAAESVEVKRVHSSSPATNALIWLAA